MITAFGCKAYSPIIPVAAQIVGPNRMNILSGTARAAGRLEYSMAVLPGRRLAPNTSHFCEAATSCNGKQKASATNSSRFRLSEWNGASRLLPDRPAACGIPLNYLVLYSNYADAYGLPLHNSNQCQSEWHWTCADPLKRDCSRRANYEC